MAPGTSPKVTRRVALGLLGAGLAAPCGVRAAPPSDADRAALASGNGEFGLDLYAQLRATRGNLFYSPYSISCALAMTYAGARGVTADQMATALRFPLSPDRVHSAFKGLIREINAPAAKRSSELSTANALWLQKGVPFESGFREIAKSNYGAGLAEVDFARATETARRTINGWVEHETRDKIKDLIREGLLSPQTVLVLTNAIYFKGAWMKPFHPEATVMTDFQQGAQGPIRNVPLMHQSGTYPYLDGGTFAVLELPYGTNEESMIIVLPREVDGLDELERTLTAGRLRDWLARSSRREVEIALPRFKATAEFKLKGPLVSMGMRRAFSPGGADFSGMIKGGGVCVDEVVHKAFVDVNEKGTEAAAATGVLMKLTSARSTPVFRADHPFLFFIRDTRTGSILFAGRLVNPLAG